MRLFFFLICPFIFKQASSFNCSSKFQDDQYQPTNSSIHLTVYHAHGPCSPLSSSPMSPWAILNNDEARVQALNNRVATNRSSVPKIGELSSKSVQVPLNPGEPLGLGGYLTEIGLGSPAQFIRVVVDTGSSFNWVQCRPCQTFCHQQADPIFNPTTSYTYNSISCHATACADLKDATLNQPWCSPSNTCTYESDYADRSYSIGYLGRDTLTLARSHTVPGFVYGCGQNNRGWFGQSAGIVGLARHRLSLVGQLSSKYGYVFSYCLPTLSTTGTLSIGPYDPSIYTFTRMYKDARDPTLYFLRLTSMTVCGIALPVPGDMYTSSRTIIDSGTIITRLPPAVYTALQTAFVAEMSEYYTRAPPYSILDTCFYGSPEGMSVPEVRLIFEDGLQLKLAARNVLYEVDNGVSCLAFASNDDMDGMSIIGNCQQQTFRIVYDVSNSRIGFAAGGCG